MKKGKKQALTIMVVFVLAAIGMAGFVLSHYLKIKKDLDRLQAEEYNTVFFSMYSTEQYAEEDWMHFRGMDAVKTDYTIADGRLMQRYMDTAGESGNTITTAYLGIDPKLVAKEEIVRMIQQYPETFFEVILAYPEMEYWTGMEEEECSALLQTYQTFAEWIIPLGNANLYFFSGEEWLICNPGNYTDTFCTNEEVSRFLMCNFDVQHAYRLNAETVQGKFDDMRSLVAKYRYAEEEYPKASDVDIVFLGDSIIGNYTNSLSVPEVVSGLSGAKVYNCGYGGKGAARNELTPISLPDVVDALLVQDVSKLPEGEQVYKGVKAFLEREKAGKQLMFVINYGLNDYFNGVPIVAEDAHDITGYSGAIRVAAEKLKAAYPKAQILLMTPNFTTYFECGQQKMSEQGGVLKDYAEAVLALSEELQVDVLDNFNELPITEENWQTYQEDGCHLNERGRFILGSRIAQKIRTDLFSR